LPSPPYYHGRYGVRATICVQFDAHSVKYARDVNKKTSFFGLALQMDTTFAKYPSRTAQINGIS
jgi:hypothetical protein